MAGKAQALEVEGRKVPLSNLDKVLYPEAKFTKGQVIDYYIRVSKHLLPHVKNRPVTLKRYPDGVRGEHFYEKNAPRFTPEWVQRFAVPRTTGGKDIQYILCNDLPTLIWLANLANLEVHPFLHQVPRIDSPKALVFDLDPGESSDVLACARVALLIREFFAGLGLECFVKVSGSKGLQLYVPLNTEITYGSTKPFAQSLAERLEQQHPELVVSRMPKELRSGKVFIDWSQNDEHKTTVSVYSLRAKADRPFVSTPVSWEELEQALRTKKPQKLYFAPEDALSRLEELGDLFAPLLRMKQRLPENIDKVASTRQSSKAKAKPKAETKSEPKTKSKALETYKEKRDFSQTPEPIADLSDRSLQQNQFVIQKHAASHLHYDFRLEMDGVLKSWAVPKGPPYEKAEKRLAMLTEDHPLAYLDFEGTIPKGQYGGGTVMVWDIGTYELTDGNFEKGKLHFKLDGSKLQGEWILIRSQDEAGKRWYFIKAGSSMPAPSAKQDDQSALTGRSMEQIARSADSEWQSNRPASKRKRSAPVVGPSVERREEPSREIDLQSLLPAKMGFVEPMLARPVREVPEGNGWMYEIKLDGFRALVTKKNGRISLFSRRGNQLDDQFPSIASALRALDPGTMLDGEIVVLDEQGRPSFNALQNWRGGKTPIFFYAFDILAYRGKDVRGLPLSDRRQLLEASALRGLHEPIRLSPSFSTSGAQLANIAREQGLEGVIAKRADSFYESGRRSGAWTKFKTMNGQELVIGGYIPGSQVFDSLLVGYYEESKLMFLAKVRNGFVPSLRREIAKKFHGLVTDVCPFANLPERKSARQGKALTKEFMKECRWLKPKLVAQIEFADWTAANNLRHARFAGLREDKDAREVVHEIAA